MKPKILILLSLVALAITSACTQCESCGHRANAQAVVSFPPASGRPQVTRVVSPSGCVVYAPDSNGNCNGIVTVIGGGFAFFITPSVVDLQAPPADFMITGSGISTTYGMPKVQYWDDYGQLLGETMASAVADDGSWLQATTPNTAQAYSGNWSVYVLNIRWDGGLEHVGSALVQAYGRDYEPPPPPPDENPCNNQDPNGPQMECEPIIY
jgi:hypothetical protein